MNDRHRFTPVTKEKTWFARAGLLALKLAGLHVAGMVAGALWAAMFVRWYYLYGVPKTDLGAGGTLYILIALVPLFIGATIGYFFVMLAAAPIHPIARVGVGVAPFFIAFFGFVLPMQSSSKASNVDQTNPFAVQPTANTPHAAAARKLTDEERAKIARLKLEIPHAAPNVVPHMLSVSRTDSGVLIGNRSSERIIVKVSRVLPAGDVWEHCPIGFTADLPLGHGKIYNHEPCAERFKNASIEYIVTNSAGRIIFQSDSAFDPLPSQ